MSNEKTEKKPNWTAFNLFRYALTLLLVSAKIGMFGASVVVDWSWWLVLAPVIFMEVAAITILVVGTIVVGIVFGVYALVMGMRILYVKYWKYR